MTTATAQKKRPHWAYLSPEAARRYATLTRDGLYELLPYEIAWRDRYESLEKRGYVLRPRYHAKWEPSWMGTNLVPDLCEDSIRPRRFHVIDATRISDDTRVAKKRIAKSGRERHISQHIAIIAGPDDHCVSAIETLPDPLDDHMELLVMPYLRPYDDPELQVVGEVLDFALQMLRGLDFLHRNRIAHRDIASPNITMDAHAMYPDGHHPVRIYRALDVAHHANVLPRIDHPVIYYYVDFGLSVHFAPGAPTRVIGKVGHDMEIPEISDNVPYDAYKADIYALGNMFDKEFLQRFDNVQVLQRLVECMKRKEPGLRPAADELLKMFQQLHALVPESSVRRHLVQRSEQPYERFINTSVAIARDSLSSLKRMTG